VFLRHEAVRPTIGESNQNIDVEERLPCVF
jgi:hypothetical protein